MTSKPCSLATQMAQDADSLTRVRNRFSKATDQQLPKIMTGLLPKLLQRLENYAEKTKQLDSSPPTDDSTKTDVLVVDSSTLSHIQKAQQDIYGIFATALERIRGNADMPVDTLMSALLPFLGSDNVVVSTWTVVLLQSGITRTTAKSMDPKMVAAIVQTLGKLHAELVSPQDRTILTDDGNEQVPIAAVSLQNLQLRWIKVSWLLIDCIMILSGHKALVDVDADHFDPKESKQLEPKSHDYDCYHHAREEAAKILCSGGDYAAVAVTSLLLDLILFWPDQDYFELSDLGLMRMNHRSAAFDENNADLQSTHIQRQRQQRQVPPVEFQRVVRQRTPNNSWSDMNKEYLRYIKLALFNFCVWPPGRGLLRDNHENKALQLCICAANSESMHGRVAVDFLTRRRVEKRLVPLPVAVSTMVLVLGEKPSAELIEGSYGNCDHIQQASILGPLANSFEMQRPALQHEIATRAVQYLVVNALDSTETKVSDTKVSKGSLDSSAKISSLLVDLCLKTGRVGDSESAFLAIQLLARIFDSLPRQNNETVLEIKEVIVNALKEVEDMGWEDLEEMRTTAGMRYHVPPGYQVPFFARNDLNRLLYNHRVSQKRNEWKRDEAIDARKDAYRLLSMLPKAAFALKDDDSHAIPNLLLRCAIHEDRSLEHYVIKAACSVLDAYVDQIVRNQEITREADKLVLQQQATMLLPSLLETACSEEASARSLGMKWIKCLLVKMDPEAALYLASHLVNDEDSSIARSAKKLISKSTPPKQLAEKQAKSQVSYYDLRNADQALNLRWMLQERVVELSASLGLSAEECQKLLAHHHFSVSKTLSASTNNRNVLESCGLLTDASMQIGDTCGICYDELNPSNQYSLRCGHNFCTSCWAGYLNQASEVKSGLTDLRCPQHECQAAVLTSDIQVICPALLSQLDESFLESFIKLDPLVRLCPGADCQCVALMDEPAQPSQTITCDACSSSFCFECGENPHLPASCEAYLSWKQLKETSRIWVKRHSKPCPGCNAPIEKNGGCNHIQCSSCQADFCWVCLALLDNHLEPHNCNRYDPIDSAEDDFERRALFTAKRFDAHDHAEDFAATELENFQPAKLLEAFWFLDESDATILQQGLEVLIQARSFLKYSYVASLGLRHGNVALKKHECHQACLEMFTERLSQLTEMSLQRLYLERGDRGVKGHFRRLAFFTASVANYQERMSSSISPATVK